MASKETIITSKGQVEEEKKERPKLSADEFHRKMGLDFCFLMDITYSMDRYVEATSRSLQELIRQL